MLLTVRTGKDAHDRTYRTSRLRQPGFRTGHASDRRSDGSRRGCDRLTGAGYRFDIAAAPPFAGGVNARIVERKLYPHLIVVSGPFEQRGLENLLLRRFWHCRLVGLNLSMRIPLNERNPFDCLIERDSSLGGDSDLVLASVQPSGPVVGGCLVEDYPQGDARVANAAVERLIQVESAAVIRMDTRLDLNSAGRTDWTDLQPYFCSSVSAVCAAASAFVDLI